MTDDDLMSHVRRLATDPEITDLDELVFIEPMDIHVTGDGLRKAAFFMASDAGRNTPHRGAIVASSAALFGMARMYEAYRERPGVVTRVFTSEAEAVAWLRSPAHTADD